jgi:hypothetical protein
VPWPQHDMERRPVKGLAVSQYAGPLKMSERCFRKVAGVSEENGTTQLDGSGAFGEIGGLGQEWSV